MALIPQAFLNNTDFFEPFFRGFQVSTDAAGGVDGQQQLARRSAARIPVDFVETDAGYELMADIPGVSKDSIKVSVDHDVLRISVEQEKKEEKSEEREGARYHRVERSSFYSDRALRLPELADMVNMTAKYDDGVLKLQVPKKSVQTSSVKTITIG